MHSLIARAYPICRSITGDGYRKTMDLISEQIPLKVHEVATGTKVFDWTVPKEWNVRDAYVKDQNGRRVIDFQKSNLHVLNYSVPIHAKLSLQSLKEHLFSDPEKPHWIPYRTSYYKEKWGFCLSHDDLQTLAKGEYDVCIDSSLTDGSLTYGEYYLQGETTDEVLISTHCCHPSLCNDNLSGIALATYLARMLSGKRKRLSYRFLFIPGTIGAITWLALNEGIVHRIKHGLVVACVGDAGTMSYKKSRRGDAEIDRAVIHALQHSGKPFQIREFTPYGYDERQYCSPAFNLPVGSLNRTPHGQFAEYHTSADNLDFVKSESLVDSLDMYLRVLRILDNDRIYLNQNPRCEPQLGKRGIYSTMGGRAASPPNEFAMLWVLNLSDGKHSLLHIAERSGLEFETVFVASEVLREHGLLKETS